MRTIGHYTIDQEVARGGAGVVYRGREPGGDSVAVKLLVRGGSAGNVARFRREVSALARLNHPGIVRLRDAGTTEHGHRYLVMDFVEGQSLGDRLQQGPLPVSLAVQLVGEVARALASAHAEGIVHRDVKPANVILSRDGRPLLTDFGLAMESEGSHSLTTAGNMLGTPGFMPPEQCMGELHKLGPPADVYALGATLYACLTGIPPFVGEAWEVLAATTERTPEPPSRHRRSVGADLDAICLRCLQKSPRDRYRDASELADVLELYLSGESVEVPVGLGRNRWARFAGVAALALVAGSVTLAWLTRGGDAAPTPPAEVVSEGGTLDPAQIERLAELEEEDRPGEALELGEALLARFPNNPLLMSHVGRERVMLDDPERGMPLLQRATELAPDEPKVWLHWAIAHLPHTDQSVALRAVERSLRLAETAPALAVRARIRVNQGDWEIARRDLERAEALDPSYPHVITSWAVFYGAQGKLDRAIEVCDRAIAEHPNRASRYFMRAQLRLPRGDPPDVILADLDQALAQRSFPQAHEYRAKVLISAERWEEAVDAWSRYLEVRPDSAKGWVERARLRVERLNDAEGGLADAQRGAALAPDSYDANHALAMAYHKADRDVDALKLMDYLVAERPDNTVVRRQRARLRLNEMQLQGAYDDGMLRLRVRPGDLVALEITAISATLLRRPDALPLARRFFAAAPRNVLAFDGLVTALWHAEAIEELIEHTGRVPASQLTPQSLAYRGGALMQAERELEAAEALAAVLARDPRCRPGLAISAELALVRGDPQTAIHFCDRLLAETESAIAHLFRARARMIQRSLGAARRDLERFAELGPSQLGPEDTERRLKIALDKLAQLEGR